VTYPNPPPVPYRPYATTSPLRILYPTLVQVLRMKMKVINGTPTLTWAQVPDVIDPYVDIPGQMMCRLDLMFVKRTDMPMPLVAGAAQQRQGTAFFDSAIDPDTGACFVLAGDRLKCLAGPVMGTFEIRQIPNPAIDLTGSHHIEVSIWEVSKSIAQGSQTPFPGSEGPDA
jgi:hypothetical protein